MLPFCQDQKIAVIPWSPLARGLLTGKRAKERNETIRAKTDEFGKTLCYADSDFDMVNRLTKIATQRKLPQCADSIGLDAGQTRYYRPGYRCKQARAPGRCRGCIICETNAGRNQSIGRTLQATRCSWAFINPKSEFSLVCQIFIIPS